MDFYCHSLSKPTSRSQHSHLVQLVLIHSTLAMFAVHNHAISYQFLGTYCMKTGSKERLKRADIELLTQ